MAQSVRRADQRRLFSTASLRTIGHGSPPHEDSSRGRTFMSSHAVGNSLGASAIGMHTTTWEHGMRTTNAMITLVAGILLSACGKQEAPAADTAKPAAATTSAPATATKLGETSSMKTPE